MREGTKKKMDRLKETGWKIATAVLIALVIGIGGAYVGQGQAIASLETHEIGDQKRLAALEEFGEELRPADELYTRVEGESLEDDVGELKDLVRDLIGISRENAATVAVLIDRSK